MRWRQMLSAVVRKSLAGHAWLGLVIGAPMYLICLSGTLAVFNEELGRWEQPAIAESQRVEPATVQRAVAAALARLPQPPPHLYVNLPTSGMPRVSVLTDDEQQAWFVNADGSLGERVAHRWTDLLLNLHIYLHLPSTLGLLVVGASGALLVGLIVSGFLAHPRIFKDAFRLRLGGSRHLEQADLHNRLSVWGAPFHLVIALTGAGFGLGSLMFLLLGVAFHRGSTEAAVAVIYGDELKIQGVKHVPAVGTALARIGSRMDSIAPAGMAPHFLTVHDPLTEKQYVEVAVEHPGRLIWAEYYRFDGEGGYVGRSDYSDGAIGRQVIYSFYRIHFGSFGGWPVKVLYGLLGLALTIISATGINIWLARRTTRDYVNDLWIGTIWGAPAALALTAVFAVLFGVVSAALFWTPLAGAIAWSLRLREPVRARRHLCIVTASLLAVLLAGHVATFGVNAIAPAAGWINAGIFGLAIVLFTIALNPLATRENP